uniref:Complement C4B (Chido/Rodgers blood group) n=1 Tax=Gasterosteus aculeatus aculeatus TaxID=481459 RepID=G3NYX1_GASAC|nr:complement C4-B isoform X1 [Gasterosteus aculeatus aculeatus]
MTQRNRSCTMGRYVFCFLFLISTVECSAGRFFISAPHVFHVGVNEKVFVQMGNSYLNNPVTLYLEHEATGTLVSEKKTDGTTTEGQIKTVELMIERNLISTLSERFGLSYLLLVAESPSFGRIRKVTRVMVSKRRGYIFIQTDQPIYTPAQNVRYRIFTLDHTLRPHDEVFHIKVYNSAGNRVIKSQKIADRGILQGSFPLPDVSKLGTWKITAHYVDDAYAASREFKVQKFVLPSFEVNIEMEQRFILLKTEQLNFSISAKYSHGEQAKGAYHCQFGVIERDKTHGQKTKPVFIRGLELTGRINGGAEAASVQIANLNAHLEKQQNKSFSELQRSGGQLYLRVFVTNIQSGETQEAEVNLPIISHKYTLDLSRTRSYFLPGYPLDVVLVVSLPDGSPAAGVGVKIDVPTSTETSWEGKTDGEGAVFPVFNIPSGAQITVDVSADGQTQTKVLRRASSPTNSYLYLSFTNRMYSVGESMTVTYNTINSPNVGFIYFMVLSRGILIKHGSLRLGTSVKDHLQITSDMVPSFRLIGYYYNERGDIIADSVWVDVSDECEMKVKVEAQGLFEPGKKAAIEFDLYGQRATVALLAVDKAIYALNADNKLTGKQVFSSMQSYDLGCSYSGGSDPAAVLTNAGLSSVSQSQSMWKRSDCGSQNARQKRAVDLQQEMMTIKSNFSDEQMQECCVRGFSLIPMRRTCQERVKRVSMVKNNPACADTFLKCCLEGQRLRQKKIRDDAEKGLGRTAEVADIEQFFWDTGAQYIRRYFPPSFGFTTSDINGKGRMSLTLPDSITTWEIQVVTLSAATGFCVVKPLEVRSFKAAFVSLQLPYSVKRYEQISISPVIYNYGQDQLQVAVHMEQTEGLCSPGSATAVAFVNITVEPESSQLVSFSAVPMVTGSIPIKIRLYDMEKEFGIDAIEKTLSVMTEGLEKRIQETQVFKLDGKSTKSFQIDGMLPDETVPDSTSNIFISAEADGFSSPLVRNLLSPEKVFSLIQLPTGCLQQTTLRLTPTLSAVRYLDMSDQWEDLPPGTRDDALDKIETGFIRIFPKEKPNSSYGSWFSTPASNWLTALILKVLSLMAERQSVAFGEKGRKTTIAPDEKIKNVVNYLLTAQNTDGSFRDPNPVLHRGVLNGPDQHAAMTAFINLALNRSLQFLNTDLKSNAEASITRSTNYLLLHLEELQHPLAVAITVYCLAVCLPQGTDHSSAWTRLKTMATQDDNGCYLWTTTQRNQVRADAITVETTAYALLAAVELGHTKEADKIACWLTTQENYFGGYKSSQDTIMVLEALAEYELKGPVRSEVNLVAEFTVQGRKDIIQLVLDNKKEKVETDLKKFSGNNIKVQMTGNGDAKIKIVKAYHVLDPVDSCDLLSISVTVEGKVKYTDKIIENYEYYDDDDNKEEKEGRVPQSPIEWFDVRSRNKRDLDSNFISEDAVTYTICVSHSLKRNLTGMGIADVTLLSGFEVVIEDLDKLRETPEEYISHYEVSNGRVLLYFNELFDSEECISFDAIQRVPVGLLQPASAVFYDYYEPNRMCTVSYSAPRRSNMVSRLCSEDVCQCAERPCHKIQNTFKSQIRQKVPKSVRLEHACFFPTVDYAYLVEILNVSMKSNFDMYKTRVNEVLRSHGDTGVGEDSIRVFAKRRQCKGQLDVGKQYLIMGKDGSTTDSSGKIQYLLESNTWVERKPLEEECKKSAHRTACSRFNVFKDEYKIYGCRQ